MARDKGKLPLKCPRCGEGKDGLFSGHSCDWCGWPVEVHSKSFGALRLAEKEAKAAKAKKPRRKR